MMQKSNLKERVVQIYEVLHSMPEAGFSETRTKAFIVETLEHCQRITNIYSGKYGLIYLYRGKSKKMTVCELAFRSELDAIAIDEEKGIYYHGCGHDAHSSMLLSMMEYIDSLELEKNILFIFQASEEKVGGAQGICNFLIKNQFEISKIYALHVTSDLYSQYVSINQGSILASGMTYEVRLESLKGGHAAAGNNQLLEIFREMIGISEKLSTEKVKCEIINFASNGSHNVLPTQLSFSVSFRGREEESCTVGRDSFFRILENFLRESIRYEMIEVMNYPSVINEKSLYETTCQVLKNSNVQLLSTPFLYSSDDFAFYRQKLKIPTCYFFIGAYNKGAKMHTQEFVTPKSTLLRGLYILFLLINYNKS